MPLSSARARVTDDSLRGTGVRIVVKHFADPDETISAIPGKVTVEVEGGEGYGVVGGEPIELALGQQANVEIEGRITGNETIVGLPPDTRPEVHLIGTTVQAVIDGAASDL